MGTHNICFHGEIRNVSLHFRGKGALSVAMSCSLLLSMPGEGCASHHENIPI